MVTGLLVFVRLAPSDGRSNEFESAEIAGQNPGAKRA